MQIRSLIAALLAVPSLALPATSAMIAEEAVRRTFAPEDFTQYAPRTALDMVQQIPGFSIREGDTDERGLGQADTNVLINGERISGKSNGPVDALSRIPADNVIRLEIVDGASLDIAGLSGQVLNAVVEASGISGQFRYGIQWRSERTDFRWGNGEISVSGGGSGTDWSLSFENDQFRDSLFGPELAYDADGVLIDTRDEYIFFNGDRPTFDGSFSRTAGNGNILNLNGRAQWYIFRSAETSARSGTIDVDRDRLFRQSEDEFNYELGGDYEFGLGGGRLKLIGLRRFETSPTVNALIVEYADGRPPTGSVFTRTADEAETILRAEYRWDMLSGDWQASLEGAKNSLDIEAALEERDANGILQPVAFPGATAGVSEDRAEGALSYSRALTPNLNTQVSLGAEYSEISQSGPQGLTRSFVRPKGFVTLDWAASDDLDLSFRIEREVGQLNFFDFIATVNLSAGNEDATNASLVPSQRWLFQLEANQSLGAFGSINLRGYYRDITDIVDRIPLPGGGESAGNIDSARLFGLETELTLLSEPFGWPGGKIDLTHEARDTRVVDPVLFTPRGISGDLKWRVRAEARQDFKGTDWAIGGFLSHEKYSPFARVSEIHIYDDQFAFAEAFVEHKDIFGLTLKGLVGNLLDRNPRFDRIIYNDKAAGDIDVIENRRRSFGTIFRVELGGSF